VSVLVFYALERLARQSKERNAAETGAPRTEQRVFLLHIATFGVMNVLIGYLLLHTQSQNLRSLGFFSLAMLVKLLVNDHGLHELHRDLYDEEGRWFLAVAVLLNVLKEELPAANEARYWAFAGGALVYGAVLLAF
jgi:hypothetical protein